MTQVVSFGHTYCKMSMLIYLRSSNSLMRLGLGRWRGNFYLGDGEETDKTPSKHRESQNCLSIPLTHRMQASSARL